MYHPTVHCLSLDNTIIKNNYLVFKNSKLCLDEHVLVSTHLSKFDCKTSIFAYVNHARFRSWNQPVQSNEGKVSCSRKQREPLMGLKLTTDRHPPITSQMRYHSPRSVLNDNSEVLVKVSQLSWMGRNLCML